ncbi:MAG: hypothetical protein D6830_05285, partial [Ignavibacteria bacterium]
VKIQPGFSGTITFKGTWPTDILQTRIVLFKSPLLTPDDFNATNLRYVSEIIPSGVTSYDYNSLSPDATISNIEPGEYSYLAVAQSNALLSFARQDWRVVGLYVIPPDTINPAKLIIPSDRFLENINIICDFDNPPNQPPGE